MRNFFSKFGIWLLGALAVATVVLCIISSIGSGVGVLQDVAGTVVSPFRKFGTAISTRFREIGDYFDDLESLQEENEALKQENAELEEALRQAQFDQSENEILRQALNLRQQHRDYSLETARITDRSTGNWTSTFTLSKGTSHGIAQGDCVIDTYGNLIGIITEAGSKWSTVTTILDTDSQIGATVFRTGEVAVTSGELSLMAQGNLKLEYLSSETQLISGDLVVTSGLGGYYPSDIPIGSVVELDTDKTGVAQYAVLSPKVDFSSLSEVFVITDFDVVE